MRPSTRRPRLETQSGDRSRPEQVALLREHVRHFSVVELPTDNLMIYNVYPRTCAEAVLYFAAQHDGTVCRE